MAEGAAPDISGPGGDGDVDDIAHILFAIGCLEALFGNFGCEKHQPLCSAHPNDLQHKILLFCGRQVRLAPLDIFPPSTLYEQCERGYKSCLAGG